MKIGATPAKLIGVVRAIDEQVALAEMIERHAAARVKRLIVLRAAS